MQINELIDLELADTAVHQARWQARVKQIILEQGITDPEELKRLLAAEADKLGGRLVRRSVDMGLRWLAEGQR